MKKLKSNSIGLMGIIICLLVSLISSQKIVDWNTTININDPNSTEVK